jgi:hypothetical protein
LSGVFVSSKKKIVIKNITISTKVFQYISNTENSLMKCWRSPPLELQGFCFFEIGNVGSASGSDALRVKDMKSDMRDVPSPMEWWTRRMPTDSALDVLMLRR